MMRALGTLKRSHGYDRLLREESFSDGALTEPGLTRAKSMPTRVLCIPVGDPAEKSTKKRSKKNKSHPIFSLFNSRRKKMSAKPELVRYMEYLKEGGRWDKDDTTGPVIYYTK